MIDHNCPGSDSRVWASRKISSAISEELKLSAKVQGRTKSWQTDPVDGQGNAAAGQVQAKYGEGIGLLLKNSPKAGHAKEQCGHIASGDGEVNPLDHTKDTGA